MPADQPNRPVDQPNTHADPALRKRRTHPVTPLLTGWKVMAGVIAVFSLQGIVQLVQDVTLKRLLLVGAGLLGAIVLGILLSGIVWWSLRYTIDEDGVLIEHGILTKNRRFAPRARIESVSVQRPLLARLVGLAKVRVEVAGGSESHLDIEYVTAADAERIRQQILGSLHADQESSGANTERTGAAPSGDSVGRTADSAVAAHSAVAAAATVGSQATMTGADSAADVHAAEAGSDRVPSADAADRAPVDAMRSFLHDAVTDGELIAEVPTPRLVHSIVRDLSFWIGAVASLIGLAIGIGVIIANDGFTVAALLAGAPIVIAGPKLFFDRIESGWGFVSRITPRGLRVRFGLLNTSTNNIGADRIQRFVLDRPLLWRAPGWTRVSATVAGMENGGEESVKLLPVGTAEELRRTFGHLAAPLGTDDDLATIEHLLSAPARAINGLRPVHPLYWIGRRTEVTVLLPGALVHRSGILDRRLIVIPRDRIQIVEASDGPVVRRTGALDLEIAVAGEHDMITNLPQADAERLFSEVSHDAATRRRLRDHASWPRPILSVAPWDESTVAPRDENNVGLQDGNEEER